MPRARIFWSTGRPALPCPAMIHPPRLLRPVPSERPRRLRRLRPRVAVLSALLAVGGSLACDRNIEPYLPGEEPREPDLARIFPGPPAGSMQGGVDGGGAGEGAAAQAMAADASGPEAGAGRAAFPPSRTEGAGAAGGADAKPISGRIELAPELAGARPEGAILFVIARPEGAVGGPPLAVLRIPDPEFPVEFEIGPGDVMIPSMRFAGPISLTARLDSDGNAMTRAEVDLSSPTAPPAEPGTTGVALVLSQKGQADGR